MKIHRPSIVIASCLIAILIVVIRLWGPSREVYDQKQSAAINAAAEISSSKKIAEENTVDKVDGFKSAPKTSIQIQDQIPLEVSTRINPPSLKQFRDAQKANPHDVNPAIENYARYISQRWESSKGNNERLKVFFNELKDCALPENSKQIASATKAFCADTARMLKDENQELLNDSWFDLYQKLDDETKLLIQPLKSTN